MNEEQNQHTLSLTTLLGQLAGRLIYFLLTMTVYTIVVRSVWNHGLVPGVSSLREITYGQASWITIGLIVLRFALNIAHIKK